MIAADDEHPGHYRRDGTAMKLHNRVALVTGACAGIGAAKALAQADAGADVALNDLTYPREAEGVAAGIRARGRRARLGPADVADQPVTESVVGRAVAEWGRLDVFVPNAAPSDEGFFHEAGEACLAGFRRTIDVTMWGPSTGCARPSGTGSPAAGRQRRGRLLVTRPDGGAGVDGLQHGKAHFQSMHQPQCGHG
jgi:NAD(P)-dependent dehydrogenase (short-subunit alcohol dehydrogenase family)